MRVKHRTPTDTALVIRAIIMLGKQLERERQSTTPQHVQPHDGAPPPKPGASA